MAGSSFERTEGARVRLPTEAMLALQKGRRIEAIKIVREQTGLGLTEARSLVERAERNEPRVPRRGGREDAGILRLVVILLILGAAAAAVFLL